MCFTEMPRGAMTGNEFKSDVTAEPNVTACLLGESCTECQSMTCMLEHSAYEECTIPPLRTTTERPVTFKPLPLMAYAKHSVAAINLSNVNVHELECECSEMLDFMPWDIRYHGPPNPKDTSIYLQPAKLLSDVAAGKHQQKMSHDEKCFVSFQQNPTGTDESCSSAKTNEACYAEGSSEYGDTAYQDNNVCGPLNSSSEDDIYEDRELSEYLNYLDDFVYPGRKFRKKRKTMRQKCKERVSASFVFYAKKEAIRRESMSALMLIKISLVFQVA